LCETCEKNGRGGYAPYRDEDSSDAGSSDDSDSDSDGSSMSSSSESDTEKPVLNLNERRTRRGVYAVSKPASESSDESDEGEDDSTKPLADAADIPADGEIELTAAGSNLTSVTPSHSSTGTTSTGRNPSTPVSIRSPSSSTELTPSSSGPSATSNHSTPFRSIISTRSQKAREASNGSNNSTPLKQSSRCESVDTPSRLTRSVSLLQLSEKAKGKGKGSPAPSIGSSVVKQARGSGKDRMGKNEDGDAQPARTRPDAVKEVAKIAEVPRGSDGKPLPTCMTCSNVLPLISIDSKVVWGLETGKRDKNTKRECPRYVPRPSYIYCGGDVE
jgi:histone-lysine N-methyltransferase SUV420H